MSGSAPSARVSPPPTTTTCECVTHLPGSWTRLSRLSATIQAAFFVARSIYGARRSIWTTLCAACLSLSYSQASEDTGTEMCGVCWPRSRNGPEYNSACRAAPTRVRSRCRRTHSSSGCLPRGNTRRWCVHMRSSRPFRRHHQCTERRQRRTSDSAVATPVKSRSDSDLRHPLSCSTPSRPNMPHLLIAHPRAGISITQDGNAAAAVSALDFFAGAAPNGGLESEIQTLHLYQWQLERKCITQLGRRVRQHARDLSDSQDRLDNVNENRSSAQEGQVAGGMLVSVPLSCAFSKDSLDENRVR